MRVVVTLTTIPTRENSVIETIKSIQNNSVLPEVIYVNLPDFYPKFGRGPDPQLEENLRSMGVVINRCKDYGSLTKIIPTLEKETDPNTLIIILDDDATYGPRVIEGLVRGYIEFKTPVCYSSITYPEKVEAQNLNCNCLLIQGHGSDAEIMECAFGVLIPRGAFEKFPTFVPLSEHTGSTDAYFSDDYVISHFLDKQGIPKKVVYFQQVGRFCDDWSSIWKLNENSQTHSLSKEGNIERYKRLKL